MLQSKSIDLTKSKSFNFYFFHRHQPFNSHSEHREESPVVQSKQQLKSPKQTVILNECEESPVVQAKLQKIPRQLC